MFKEIFKTIKEKSFNNNFYAIDIGTSKVTVAIVYFDSQKLKYKVAGITSCLSKGMEKGIICDYKKISSSIKSCIFILKDKTGYKAKKSYVNLSDPSIADLDSYGIRKIKNLQVEIEDIKESINSSKIVSLQKNFEIAQVLKNSFLIDNNIFTQNPIGMAGTRLEIQVKLVLASSYCIANIKKVINNCNLHLNEIVLDQFANSYVSLTKQDKKQGTCLIDIGAGTTKIIVFDQNIVKTFFVIPVAGNQITNDIAQGLNISNNLAEKLKCNLLSDELLNIDNFDKNKIMTIIEARLEEIFSIIYNYLFNNNSINNIFSVNLTGGSANFKNIITNITEKIFKLPVKINYSNNLENFGIINDPRYSTIEGLLNYKLKDKKKEIKTKNLKLYYKIKNWIK